MAGKNSRDSRIASYPLLFYAICDRCGPKVNINDDTYPTLRDACSEPGSGEEILTSDSLDDDFGIQEGETLALSRSRSRLKNLSFSDEKLDIRDMLPRLKFFFSNDAKYIVEEEEVCWGEERRAQCYKALDLKCPPTRSNTFLRIGLPKVGP